MNYCKLTIGNGFDLFCSLNTRYKDFFESESQKKIFNAIDEYEKKCFTYDEVNVIPVDFFDESTTVWDILFYKEPGRLQRKKWCEVEKFIFDFFYTKNTKDETSFTKIYNNVRNIIKNGTFNFTDLYEWHKLACIYLILKNVPTYPKDDFSSFMLEELERFEKRFGNYVHDEFVKKYSNYSIYYRDFFKNCVPDNMIVTSLDSFNYTPIEDLCGFRLEDEKIRFCNNIKHINGDYRTPIFGIDSSKFSVNDPGHIFSKTYRRITADFFEGDGINITLDEKFNDLVIFGHSLNEQDYNYYFPIFDYMRLMDVTSDTRLYFFYYIYDNKSKNKIKKENVKNLYSMLNAYEEYKTGKTKDFRLVDALSSRGRLRFKEVDRPTIL